MATQTIEFAAATGETITAKLYAAGSDTVAATASSVTEQTNRKGVYYAVVTSTLSGVYRLVVTDASDVPLATWWVALADATATYIAHETAPETVAAAVWNSLLASYTTADTFGARLVRSANSNNTVSMTGGPTPHIAAVVHDAEPGSISEDAFANDALSARVLAADAVAEIQSGLATSANQATIIDRASYALTALVGACNDAGTAAETYTLSIGGNTFTVDHAGLDATGNRGTVTLSKA